MAQLMQVRLSKGESPNLGFRLQGGKDFGTPLVIQKVNGGSPADKAGLIAGDAVIKINNTDVFNLRHKDAQDVIVRSGHAFEITVQRGGSTWKPSVQAQGGLPSHKPHMSQVAPVTKTSLAAHNQSNIGAIGTGHNVAAKPFGPQLNGAVNGSGPKLVNKQYNSPVGIYSEQSIKETLSAQTEVLATGALGVNFKKNEKNFDVSKSAVLSVLQESEKEPSHYETEPDSGIITTPSQVVGGLRHVTAPESRPAPPQPQLPPGQNICADCERLIVGVFVRIKDKNLHVECFKCSTCGSSLKNVGYYNINNKLYCDVHAKLAAKNNPPAPNLVPVTLPPGSRAPAGTISAALGGHSFPAPAPLSPRGGSGSSNPNTCAAPFQQQSAEVSNAIASTIESEEVAFNKDDVTEIKQLEESILAASKRPNAVECEHTIGELKQPINITNYLSHEGVQSSANRAGSHFASPRPFASVSSPLSPSVNAHSYSAPPPATFAPKTYAAPAPLAPSILSPSILSPGGYSSKPGVLRGAGGPGGAAGKQGSGVTFSPKRGRGVLNVGGLGTRVALCGSCHSQIRGPFISALGKIWCPDHFICATPSCRRPLQDLGFVEEQGKLYCEFCFEQYLAPNCAKCSGKIKADCLRAIGKHFHPECFKCTYCSKLFGNTPFFLEDCLPYCQDDWNELFTTKCFACGFPVEAGDRWVEALNNNYHTQCFNCSMCKKNLEGQSFFAKGGRPFCKNHAR